MKKSTQDLVEVYVRDRVLRGEFAPTTAESTIYILRNFARAMPEDPRKITRQDIEDWMGKPKLAPGYRRVRLSRLRTFVQWMVLNDYIPRDPSLGIKSPRTPRQAPRGLRHSDVSKLLAAVATRRDLLMILLMVQEGLRCHEVAGIEIGDVDFEQRTLLVVGKGGDERLLPISEETFTALLAYLDEYPASAGKVVRSYKDGHSGLSAPYVSCEVGDIFRRSGVKRKPKDGRSAHALRHTMAHDLINQDVNLLDVQRALGHASLMTTRKYLPNIVRDLRVAMAGRAYRFQSDSEEEPLAVL